MLPAIGMDRTATLMLDTAAKDVDEVNTHTSETLSSSSSSSTEADGNTSTAVIMTAIGVDVDSAFVMGCSNNVSSGVDRWVAGDTGMPTSPAPCGCLDSLSGGSAAASSALGAGGISAGTTKNVMFTHISPVITGLESSAPAPPPPIDFSDASPTAAAGMDKRTRAPAQTSGLAPLADFKSSSRATPSALCRVATMAPSVSATSFGGNGSRPSLSPVGLRPHADPFYPEKLITANNGAVSSLFPPHQQRYMSPASHEPMDCRPPFTASPSYCYEDSSTLGRGSTLPPYISNCPAYLPSSQGPPSASYPRQAACGTEAEGNLLDTHWQEAGNSKLYNGDLINMSLPSPIETPPQTWAVSWFPEDGWGYDAWMAGFLVDGVTDGSAASAGLCIGAVHNGFSNGGLDGDDSWHAPLVHGPHTSPPHTSYVSALPNYPVTHELASQQVFLPLGYGYPEDLGGGEYEYSDCGLVSGYAASKHNFGRDTQYSGYIPQEIECVENMVRLDYVCREILSEAEVLRRERQYCSEDTEGKMPHWCSKLTVALDLEGRSLGRAGSICIITLATYTTVYIIDMILLGDAALRTGSALKRVLESQEIIKLMFDCRADCDALYFLYHVRLQNVCDLQISSCFALFPRARLLPGMKGVFLALGIFTDEDTTIKNAGRQLFNPECGGSFDRWEERPLTDILVQYCAVDVKYFFLAELMLWDYVEQGCRLGEERLASVCNGTFCGYSKNKAKRDFRIV